MAVQQLSYGSDDGACFGQADDKIGFYGKTPVAKYSTSIATATDTTTAIAQVNAVIAALDAIGLITKA